MALKLKKLVSPLLAASLLLPSVNAFAQVEADPFNSDKPTALEMYTDLFLMRPIGIVETVLGSAVYVVALPFTLASGGAKEAGAVHRRAQARWMRRRASYGVPCPPRPRPALAGRSAGGASLHCRHGSGTCGRFARPPRHTGGTQ